MGPHHERLVGDHEWTLPNRNLCSQSGGPTERSESKRCDAGRIADPRLSPKGSADEASAPAGIAPRTIGLPERQTVAAHTKGSQRTTRRNRCCFSHTQPYARGILAPEMTIVELRGGFHPTQQRRGAPGAIGAKE